MIYLSLLITFSTLANTCDSKINEEKTPKNHDGGYQELEVNIDLKFEIDYMTILRNKFCIPLNISLDECSCKHIPQLCHVEDVLSSMMPQNNTTRKKTFKRLPVTSSLYASIAVFSSSSGVVGNLIVVIVALLNREDLSTCKLHIAELALANLIFSIVQLINSVPLFWTNQWVYGALMCKCVRTILEVGNLSTVGFILIIAYERYRLVMTPIKTQTHEGKFKHATVVTNLCIAIFSVIPYYQSLSIDDVSGRCVMFREGYSNLIIPYNTYLISLYVVTPLLILTSISVKIVSHLWDKSGIPVFCQRSAQMKICKRNRHISYVTIVVLFLFMLCTMPSRIVTLYMEIVGFKRSTRQEYLFLTILTYVTYPLQSSLNPILFSLTARNWRKDAKRSITSTMTFLRESIL